MLHFLRYHMTMSPGSSCTSTCYSTPYNHVSQHTLVTPLASCHAHGYPYAHAYAFTCPAAVAAPTTAA